MRRSRGAIAAERRALLRRPGSCHKDRSRRCSPCRSSRCGSRRCRRPRRRVLLLFQRAIPVFGAAGLPAVARGGALRAAIALRATYALVVAACRIVGGAAREVAEPVLFAGQVGAPRRLAGAAVVERAAGARAAAASTSSQAAHCRAPGRRSRSRSARVTRRLNAESFTYAQLARVLVHLDHGEAMDGDFLVHFGSRPRQRGGAAVGMQEERGQFLVRRRLVVDREQAASWTRSMAGRQRTSRSTPCRRDGRPRGFRSRCRCRRCYRPGCAAVSGSPSAYSTLAV